MDRFCYTIYLRARVGISICGPGRGSCPSHSVKLRSPLAKIVDPAYQNRLRSGGCLSGCFIVLGFRFGFVWGCFLFWNPFGISTYWHMLLSIGYGHHVGFI